MAGFFCWAPRVLGVVFALFLALFAFDTPVGLGLLVHLVPSLLFLAATVLVWFKPLWGGAVFVVLGVTTVFLFHTYRQPAAFLLVSVVPVLIGLLALAGKHLGGKG